MGVSAMLAAICSYMAWCSMASPSSAEKGVSLTAGGFMEMVNFWSSSVLSSSVASTHTGGGATLSASSASGLLDFLDAAGCLGFLGTSSMGPRGGGVCARGGVSPPHAAPPPPRPRGCFPPARAPPPPPPAPPPPPPPSSPPPRQPPPPRGSHGGGAQE